MLGHAGDFGGGGGVGKRQAQKLPHVALLTGNAQAIRVHDLKEQTGIAHHNVGRRGAFGTLDGADMTKEAEAAGEKIEISVKKA